MVTTEQCVHVCTFVVCGQCMRVCVCVNVWTEKCVMCCVE